MHPVNDLIFVSMEDWDDVWRRNQFVCAELARRHPDRKILFVGLPIDVSNRVRRGDVRNLMGRHTRPVGGGEGTEGVGNITLTHPVKLLPNTLAAGRRFNEWMFRRHVRRVADRLGLREPVLWLNPHSAGHLAGRVGESAVVYDITDDWTTITQSPRLARLVAEQDAALCRKADATIVCSERLYELKKPLTSRLHLIANGVDSSHYKNAVGDSTSTTFPMTAGWEKPVFGYTGSIHPDRVDVGLVEAVARKLEEGTIAMVGPDMLPEADRKRLLATGRVALPGPVAYRDIPAVMRAFDVSITPHRVTPFTESLNPIKLWEYLAAGKPIVSTPVAGFRDHPGLVYLAGEGEGFVAALGQALGEPAEMVGKRRAAVADHGWDKRVDRIEAVIAGCLARRSEQSVPSLGGGDAGAGRRGEVARA